MAFENGSLQSLAIKNNKDLLYSAGNYFQYRVITYNGKAWKRIHFFLSIYNWITLWYTQNIVRQLYFSKKIKIEKWKGKNELYFEPFRFSLLSKRQSIPGSVPAYSLARRMRRLVKGDWEPWQYWKPGLQEAGLETTQELWEGCKNGK